MPSTGNARNTENEIILKTGEFYYTEDTFYVLNRNAETNELFFSVTELPELSIGELNHTVENDKRQVTLKWSKPSNPFEPNSENYIIELSKNEDGELITKTYKLDSETPFITFANLANGDYTCTVYAAIFSNDEQFYGERETVEFKIGSNYSNPFEEEDPVLPNPPPSVPEYSPEEYTPKTTQSNYSLTRSAVLVSAAFNSDTVANYYSTNGGKTWKKYKKPVKMSTNGTVLFKSHTALGKVFTAAHEVSNIDKLKPIIQHPFAIVNGKDITVSFFADGTGSAIARTQLKYKSKTSSYTTLEDKGTSFALTGLGYGVYTYQARVYDEAGNVSKWSKKQQFAVVSTAADTDGIIEFSGSDAMMSGYVGIGDASDTYTFTFVSGGNVSLYADRIDSRIKLSIYNLAGKKIKSITAKYSGNNISNLYLEAGTYNVVVESADKGKGKYNTDYQVRLNSTAAVYNRDAFNFETGTGNCRSIDDVTQNEVVGNRDISDAYKFTLPNSSSSVQIDTGSNVNIDLYDSQFRKLQTGIGQLSCGNMTSGDYYLNISASGTQEEKYNLAVNFI